MNVAIAAPLLKQPTTLERLSRTVALLERRGYAVGPARLGQLCLGGPLSEAEVRSAILGGSQPALRAGLVAGWGTGARAEEIARRAAGHEQAAAPYRAQALRFTAWLVALNPYILGVSIAGSLASGGFRPSDDIDFNLIVADGRRHLAYVALNGLGLLQALAHRGKPVDALSRRPLAPRLMTANLILERSQCFPLARQDEDMAFELLQSQPIWGQELHRELVAANPRLREHFPQLGDWPRNPALTARPRLPKALFPRFLDRPARALGETAWRYQQWTRRREPEALARVALVRLTMRPYTLFERP
jgi:hypothetical protein